MQKLVALGALIVGVACSSEVTGPCNQLVRPVLVGRLVERDIRGCVVKVDSIFSKVDVLADTFRVCGFDTAKVSRAAYKFTDDIQPC